MTNSQLDDLSAGITHYNDGRKEATFYLDPWEQMDQVVLYPGISTDDELHLLRIAASHAVRYVVRRRNWNGILQWSHADTVSPERSAEAFDDAHFPDKIAGMGVDELQKTLREIGVTVVYASVMSVQEAIESALSDSRLRALSVGFVIGEPSKITNRQDVMFFVDKPAQFRIWNHVGKPGDGLNLYIVPGYHPVLSSKTSVNLINGDTDALICGNAVVSVSAPADSCPQDKSGLWAASWRHVNHPFYGAGGSVPIQISPTKMLSAASIIEVKTLLLAMLEQEDTYLSVSGGFHAPYGHPQNIARQAGLRLSTWNGQVRGSEGDCVWAHQVLEKEGELAGAYVPEWFVAEGWMSAYERMRKD